MLTNIKLKLSLLLLFICLNVSTAFGLNSEAATVIPLPSDKNPIIWKTYQNEKNPIYVEGYYNDKIGNQYSVRIYKKDKGIVNKTDFFANKLYELFGFSTLPQRIVEAKKITEFYTANNLFATITKINPDLKSFNNCSSEELANIQEPLAKLYLISVLIGNKFSIYSMRIAPQLLSLFASPSSIISIEPTLLWFEESEEIFIKNKEIYITHSPYSFSDENVAKTADEFYNLIEPQNNWIAAKIFQEPFKNYILKNPQKFIDWLESSWDENKVDALFKESGLENQEILLNLKLRFQDLKNKLVELKTNGYEPYTSQKIVKLIEEKASNNEHHKVYNNIHYEFKKILPKIEKQMFICTDSNKIWLELTNYESLVNGNESNKIVKIYIGNVSDNKALNVTEKYPIEIYDPETSFIFIKAIVGYWDNISRDHAINSISDLAQALQVGYQEIFYHFGFPNTLENKDVTTKISSFKEFVEFYQSMQEKYVIQAKNIERLVTREEIEKRKTQGLHAYYPNPSYLNDIFLHKRPFDMKYKEYILKNKRNFLCNRENILLEKSKDTKFDHCDKYNKVLEKVYPNDITYLNDTNNFHLNDFKRVKNIYAFRGEDRSIDELYDANGIWPKDYINEDKNKLLEREHLWKIRVAEDGTLHHGSGPYISTSKVFEVTEGYGKNVYVVLADGGLILPQDINGKKVDDSTLREIAVPGGVTWQNVIGVRERTTLEKSATLGKDIIKHPIGPVYLKKSLAEEDPKNFWQILQIMEKKPQCTTKKPPVLEITKNCMDLLNKTNEKDATAEIFNKYKVYYQKITNLDNQDPITLDLLQKASSNVKLAYSICQSTIASLL